MLDSRMLQMMMEETDRQYNTPYIQYVYTYGIKSDSTLYEMFTKTLLESIKYEKAHFPVKTNYQSGCDYNNRKCTPYTYICSTSHRIHMW